MFSNKVLQSYIHKEYNNHKDMYTVDRALVLKQMNNTSNPCLDILSAFGGAERSRGLPFGYKPVLSLQVSPSPRERVGVRVCFSANRGGVNAYNH